MMFNVLLVGPFHNVHYFVLVLAAAENEVQFSSYCQKLYTSV